MADSILRELCRAELGGPGTVWQTARKQSASQTKREAKSYPMFMVSVAWPKGVAFAGACCMP